MPVNYGNGGVFDLGAIYRNVSQMHNREALTRNELNPNSLDNQYRQAQLNALNEPAGGGLSMSPISYKDATGESIAAAIEANDPSLLERIPYKPFTVDTKTHRNFYDIHPETRVPTLIDSIPIENFDAARDSALGTNSAAEGGLPSSYKAPDLSVTGGQSPSLGGGNTQPAMQPVPSAAQLAGKAETAKKEAAEKVKYQVQKAKYATAMKLYTGGIDSLRTALEKTTTGPFIGKTWPVTAQAQVAEQAKAMMLPILKQIVRGPGEGVFTDADALAVLALIPDRVVDEDARDQIFANMEAMMSNFLNPVNPFPEPKTDGDQLDDDDPLGLFK